MIYRIKFQLDNFYRLKKSLLFMFPENSIFINDLENHLEPKFTNFILVNNDEICFDKNYDYNMPCIYSNIFINNVELLKHCNEKTFVIQFENYNDLMEIDKREKIHHRNYALNTNNLIIIDNEYYTINVQEYELFFSKFKTINYNTYIRSIKLKNIV